MTECKTVQLQCEAPTVAILEVPNQTFQGLFPFLPGLAIASALSDISQQKPSDSKDKTSGVRNRKPHLSTRQGTCV